MPSSFKYLSCRIETGWFSLVAVLIHLRYLSEVSSEKMSGADSPPSAVELFIIALCILSLGLSEWELQMKPYNKDSIFFRSTVKIGHVCKKYISWLRPNTLVISIFPLRDKFLLFHIFSCVLSLLMCSLMLKL